VTALSARTRLAASAGQAVARLSRRLGTGEGSVIGGRITLALDPKSLGGLAASRTVALVSGTNGKTTTTAMLAAALGTSGDVVTNGVGSNMFGGMVGALSGSDAPLVVLETDEAHLAATIAATQPRLVLLLNLSRDQLDRVGEVRSQAAKWREGLRDSPAIVVANADDPMVVWSVETARTVVWATGGGGWHLDASSCPACGKQIKWAGEDWSCEGCDLRRPQPHAQLTAEKSSPDSVRTPVQLAIPGEINKRNAVLALTSAVLLGAEPAKAAGAVAKLQSPGGRFMKANIGGVDVRLILAKNPAGWSEALRIAGGRGPVVTAINARVQDGRDPSWLWDVPFDNLKGRFVVATGERSRDVAVRLRYAGVEHEHVRDLTAAVQRAGAVGGTSVVDVIGNYSSFQEYRALVR
jgi:lipid II isoglutaminyl synthase (glutamine-hydrolysing)